MLSYWYSIFHNMVTWWTAELAPLGIPTNMQWSKRGATHLGKSTGIHRYPFRNNKFGSFWKLVGKIWEISEKLKVDKVYKVGCFPKWRTYSFWKFLDAAMSDEFPADPISGSQWPWAPQGKTQADGAAKFCNDPSPKSERCNHQIHDVIVTGLNPLKMVGWCASPDCIRPLLLPCSCCWCHRTWEIEGSTQQVACTWPPQPSTNIKKLTTYTGDLLASWLHFFSLLTISGWNIRWGLRQPEAFWK
jgi:hypothetical protein